MINQTFFTTETKRQIEIGKKLSLILKDQKKNAYQAITELVAQCLDRDDGWKKFHRESLQNTEIDDVVESQTAKLASYELSAGQYALKGQYESAADEIARLIDEGKGLSDIDRGWYLQLQAEYLCHLDRLAAMEKQLKAHDLNRSLLKPPRGITYRKMQLKKTDQVYAIIEWMKKSNEPNALVSKAGEILDRLSFGISSERFEEALSELAEIIGFQSQRPDKETGRGPDVLWCMTDGRYLVIEAKNQVKLQRQKIYKSEAGQLGQHVTWFNEGIS